MSLNKKLFAHSLSGDGNTFSETMQLYWKDEKTFDLKYAGSILEKICHNFKQLEIAHEQSQDSAETDKSTKEGTSVCLGVETPVLASEPIGGTKDL